MADSIKRVLSKVLCDAAYMKLLLSKKLTVAALLSQKTPDNIVILSLFATMAKSRPSYIVKTISYELENIH